MSNVTDYRTGYRTDFNRFQTIIQTIIQSRERLSYCSYDSNFIQHQYSIKGKRPWRFPLAYERISHSVSREGGHPITKSTNHQSRCPRHSHHRHPHYHHHRHHHHHLHLHISTTTATTPTTTTFFCRVLSSLKCDVDRLIHQ